MQDIWYLIFHFCLFLTVLEKNIPVLFQTTCLCFRNNPWKFDPITHGLYGTWITLWRSYIVKPRLPLRHGEGLCISSSETTCLSRRTWHFLKVFWNLCANLNIEWVKNSPKQARKGFLPLMPYPCSHFYFDIKFGDRLY